MVLGIHHRIYLAFTDNARGYIPQEILKNIPLIDNCYRFNHFENIAFFFCPTLSGRVVLNGLIIALY